MMKKEFVMLNLVMFSSLTSVLRYNKMKVISSEEHDNVELTELTLRGWAF